MKVTLYKKPDGRTESVDVKNVLPEDEAWFVEHKALLSMEYIDGLYALYADIGIEDEEGETIEAIELSGTRTCAATFHALRLQCEEMLKASAQ